jgi:gliding motility-associated protein GldM
MGHGKETPRQKMIGMMYLVLTALLALNVSKDVLNAFILVDEGLIKTTHNFFQKNESLYSDFEAAYQLNKTKVADWKTKADQVKTKTQALYDLMQEDKKAIVKKSEGDDTPAIHDDEVDLNLVNGKDNNNVPGEVMILDKKGTELKNAINEYRDFLLSLIVDKDTYSSLVTSIQSTLDTKDPPPTKKENELHSWESEHFEHLPLASVITILSKMQSDIRNSESEIISYLLAQVSAGDFKFNKIDAVVISNSDYIFKGQEYKASVFLAAYDSTKQPTVQLENGTELEVKDGKGVYSAVGSIVGERTWAGTIVLDGGAGNIIRREFKKSYQVAEANAVISPTKMNVFYRGVPNPVSISVSGLAKENLIAEITKGSIKRGGADWEVMPASGPEGEIVTVKVSAKLENVTRFMGSMDFRVKDVPDPIAEVAGRYQGLISLQDLSRAPGIKAKLKNFDFDLDFIVTEFDVSAALSGGFTKTEHSTSDKFTTGQQQIISQLKPGMRVTIDNIRAVGPDGKNRTLNSIGLKIN